MNTKQKRRLVYVAALMLVLVIVAYNTWSYYAGLCTVTMLMTFSLPAKLLLGGIAVALIFLLSCRAKKQQSAQLNSCFCGARLRDTWGYCPECGQQRKVL